MTWSLLLILPTAWGEAGIIDMSWDQMVIELTTGLVDLLLSRVSLNGKDLEMSGNIVMSDWVFLKDIVLIVNMRRING